MQMRRDEARAEAGSPAGLPYAPQPRRVSCTPEFSVHAVSTVLLCLTLPAEAMLCQMVVCLISCTVLSATCRYRVVFTSGEGDQNTNMCSRDNTWAAQPDRLTHALANPHPRSGWPTPHLTSPHRPCSLATSKRGAWHARPQSQPERTPRPHSGCQTCRRPLPRPGNLGQSLSGTPTMPCTTQCLGGLRKWARTMPGPTQPQTMTQKCGRTACGSPGASPRPPASGESPQACLLSAAFAERWQGQS